MLKRLFTFLSVAGLLGLGFTVWRGAWSMELKDAAPASVVKKVAGFSLKDARDHKTVALADFKDKKAVVVIFTGTECPINNAFMPRLSQLHEEYSGKGVQFLAINSNTQDTPERVADHARKNEIPFPVLKDEGAAVADQFGARRTPEVFLLDPAGRVLYQGRIDDQFGVGYRRAKPTRRDLVEALDEALAGKAVAVPSTPVAGCLISRTLEPKAGGAITYTNQIARIMQKNCQECHRPGQIGPLSLLTYKQAASWAGTIREVVEDRRMPPWHADPQYGKFANNRSLAKSDRDTLLAWIDQGCPKGDDKDLPPPKEFVEGWTIGKPDAIFTMKEAFAVPAEAPKYGIPYQYFTIETNLPEDRWIERAEARPDATAVVHHIVVFIVPPGQKFEQRDPSQRVLCGTAPGDMPFISPPGAAKKLPKGAKLVLQMHYTPNGKAVSDRSSVGLVFARVPVERQVRTMPILNPRIKIEPGEGNYQIESAFTFKEDGHILSFMPHMHLRGKDFLYEAVYPDGNKEILLSVPRYNFNWQSVYRFEKPLAMPKGAKIHCVAHFDNSEHNPNNPDSTQTVYWGDQTWEEMMIGWMDYVYDKKAE
jgi:peroxiredoxin